MNCALSAEAAEYSPKDISFQRMMSGSRGLKLVSHTRDHRCTNSCRRDGDAPTRRLRSRIQLLCLKAEHTDLFFFLDLRKRLGAMSFGRLPFTHPECQKLARFPFPMVIEVQATNNHY